MSNKHLQQTPFLIPSLRELNCYRTLVIGCYARMTHIASSVMGIADPQAVINLYLSPHGVRVLRLHRLTTGYDAKHLFRRGVGMPCISLTIEQTPFTFTFKISVLYLLFSCFFIIIVGLSRLLFCFWYP